MNTVHDLVRRAWPGEVVTSARPLTGGVSARVTALTLRRADGEERRVVLREYGARDLSTNPDVATHEFALLGMLHGHGLPVPQPLGHAPGALLQSFMDGDSGAEVGVDPAALATFLARLHALAPGGLPLRSLPDSPLPAGPPDDSLSETRLRAALAAHPPTTGRRALLHGDLWPGNTLWRSGTLSAVLDWEDAACGDPHADVGNTRLELLFADGWDAVTAFTDGYVRHTGTLVSALPVWDLRAALRPCGRLQTWGLPAAQERTMRERHARFVQAALDALERPASS